LLRLIRDTGHIYVEFLEQMVYLGVLLCSLDHMRRHVRCRSS
jgi:hypothetical protein